MQSSSVLRMNPELLAELVGERFRELMDIFTNKIPKELSNAMGSTSASHMESYYKEIMQKTMAEFPVALTSIIPLMFSQPTKFRWVLVQQLLTATATAKRALAPKYNLYDYDVDADIAQTKEQLEKLLANEFKTEVVLWRLMDEKKWDKATDVVKVIEIERETTDLPQKTEVINWKLQIACNSGNVDMFFEGLTSLLEIAGDDIAYVHEEATYAISVLLSKTLVAFRIAPSVLGLIQISKEGSEFINKQGIAFQNFLVGKIIEAIFKARIINSGESFRKFIIETKKDTVEMFMRLNPYVAAIDY